MSAKLFITLRKLAILRQLGHQKSQTLHQMKANVKGYNLIKLGYEIDFEKIYFKIWQTPLIRWMVSLNLANFCQR